MIPTPSDVRVWLAVGRTDMRRDMNGLALQVQEALQRDPHAGDLIWFAHFAWIKRELKRGMNPAYVIRHQRPIPEAPP
jgi:transposase